MRTLQLAVLALVGSASLASAARETSRNAGPPAARGRDAGWTHRTSPPAWTPTRHPAPAPGPVAGDWPRGWPVGSGVLPPQDLSAIPWLRSATSARAFLHGLPRDPAERQGRIAAAVAMIVARHGFVFEDSRWRATFEREAWYVPSRHFSPARLSLGERQALDLLTVAFR